MHGSNVRASGHPSAEGSSPSSLWSELFGGRYRIVSWYDRGGRRYVVAAPRTPSDPSNLTSRQARALALRAAGQPLKVIAFELGVSLSTASRDLDTALSLLGLGSEADLAAVLGSSSIRAENDGPVAHG